MIQLSQPTNVPGCLAVIVDEDGYCILVQNSLEWPGVAAAFGWKPYPYHLAGKEFDYFLEIQEAGRWIQANYGKVVEDPGYFNSEE